MIKKPYPPKATHRYTPRMGELVIYFEPEAAPLPSIERRHLALVISR